ncbi:acyl transferase/acyl hydrolase/lysophospholipase [Xylaria bambusicola]|uniref:acyl transferase/acyl hydrolase/lysophospholipase n=1 Tax=Xylaria bambusicola TaxID=326684 RepID=UPI002008DE6F|nr:acyl transferase/acyl hydrolase/lysophospholipase [Xylaria bambusicola]KAI0505912.1 acyl transferase/acyl hydrolase/lysophospholipase [Xylaria bambusicola]
MARPSTVQLVQQPNDNQAWAPLVLSLDGGGVKGLSSLYILREIMKRIKQLDLEDAHNALEDRSNNELPLPCHYFDFIVGTSTGGLIAIMLGRLRMGVIDCIKQYLIFSNYIFRPPRLRYIQHYSRWKVQEAVKGVVRQFCGCHGELDRCTGSEDLRQFDYYERSSDSARANRTCRAVVLTVREGGTTTFDPRPDDKVILFRTYNHLPRDATSDKKNPAEINPRALDQAQLQIHEACSATSAAPTYFKPIMLYGRKYIDGGVQANNPSTYAWNEAVQMEHYPGGSQLSINNQVLGGGQAPAAPNSNMPYALVSLGTGMTETQHQFSLKSMISFAIKNITDTEAAHKETKDRAANLSRHYFRFNVPYKSREHGHGGLAKVSMSACEKSRKRPLRNEKASTNESAPQRQGTLKLTDLRAQEDQRIYEEAENAEKGRKGGFKPSKYHYKTFDEIRKQTLEYCDGISGEINECANILRKQMVKRKNDNGASGASFVAFRQHPDPQWKDPKSKGDVSTTGSQRSRK